jgi:hypothetical protein
MTYLSTASLLIMAVKGYLVTVAVEAPVLALCLSARHSLARRIALGFWLTACSYPLVVLCLPAFLSVRSTRLTYLVIAEPLAVTVELLLFFSVYPNWGETSTPSATAWRDALAVAFANLCSFLVGEILYVCRLWA